MMRLSEKVLFVFLNGVKDFCKVAFCRRFFALLKVKKDKASIFRTTSFFLNFDSDVLLLEIYIVAFDRRYVLF